MSEPLGPNEFECENCHGVFEKAWTDAEAEAEGVVNFGDIPDEDKAWLCDGCWRKFEAWYLRTYGAQYPPEG